MNVRGYDRAIQLLRNVENALRALDEVGIFFLVLKAVSHVAADRREYKSVRVHNIENLANLCVGHVVDSEKGAVVGDVDLHAGRAQRCRGLSRLAEVFRAEGFRHNADFQCHFVLPLFV